MVQCAGLMVERLQTFYLPNKLLFLPLHRILVGRDPTSREQVAAGSDSETIGP